MRQKVRSAVYSLVFLIPVAACLEASIAATPPAIPRVELENSRGLSQTTNLGPAEGRDGLLVLSLEQLA